MAAHLEGKAVGVLDMAGLAQKGGAVFSHIRIAEKPEDIHAIRIAAGGADLVLGGDIVVAGTKQGARRGRSTAHRAWWSTRPRSCPASSPAMPISRCRASGSGAPSRPMPAATAHFVDASRIATALFGQTIAANMFMLGYAYQLGALPLSAAAIERAIELNGEAVAMNKAAFHWGRRAAADRAAVEELAAPATAVASDARRLSESFDEMVARRVKFLTAYQNAAYAARYRGRVDKAEGGRGRARARQDAAWRKRWPAICSS